MGRRGNNGMGGDESGEGGTKRCLLWFEFRVSLKLAV